MRKRTWGRAALATAAAVALACATAPAAFAAGQVGQDGEFANKTAKTQVTVGVSTDQIAASVPLTLKVQAKTIGGDLVVPQNYKIKNKSPMAIHVESMKGAINASSPSRWTLTTTDHAANSFPTDPAVNELTFKVKGTALTGADQALTGIAWNVDAATDASTPSELDLALAGSTTQLNTSTEAADLLTVTYVIAPGANS